MRSSPHLRQRLSGPRFRSPELDVLLIDARYHLVGELRRALESWGHRVRSVPVADSADAMVRSILGALAEHPADFVLTVNHFGFDTEGALGEVLETLEVPVAAWYVDAPAFVLRGRPVPAAGTSIVFSWERTALPLLEKECETRWLPLATDPVLFSGRAVEPGRREIAFVGNSGRAAQKKWQDRLEPEDEPTVARLALALEKRGSEVLSDPAVREDPVHADRVAAATWRANSKLRARFLGSFAPEELVVLGDEGWRELLPGVKTLPGPSYGGPLAHVYRDFPVHLNITSLQMPTAVNQRVFDVPAAGGFVLTDTQDDLQELFEEDELVSWTSFEEAVDKARFYARHPARRRALAERARSRVLAEHTYRHRVATLVEAMRARFGRRSAVRAS